jgi:hypothetical protein
MFHGFETVWIAFYKKVYLRPPPLKDHLVAVASSTLWSDIKLLLPEISYQNS